MINFTTLILLNFETRQRGKGEHGQTTPHSCIYLFIYLEQPQISINSRYFKTICRLITGFKKKKAKVDTRHGAKEHKGPTHKEEPKPSYKYSTNRRNQKQARNTFHFRNINVKKKICYRLFATRRRDTEKSGCEEKEQNQSGTYDYALLLSRNTSIAPRYILPNARTNIHPVLLITARSSMPLPPRR